MCTHVSRNTFLTICHTNSGFLVTAQGFPPFNETARIEAINSLNEAFEPLRRLAPDTGAYINEVGLLCHSPLPKLTT